MTGRRLRQLAELPVSVLETVGPRTVRELELLGITTVLDLLQHTPRRMVDASRLAQWADLRPDELATVLGRVQRVSRSAPPRGRRRAVRVEVVVTDDSGTGRVVFFNQPWRAVQLSVGTEALFVGKAGTFRGDLQLVNPVVEVLRRAEDAGSSEGVEDVEEEPVRRGRIIPVYPLTDKTTLTSARLSRLVAEALRRSGTFADPVEDRWRRRFDLVDRTSAYNDIHRPTRFADRDAARRRLAFDELLRLQLALVRRRAAERQRATGIEHVVVRPDGSPTLVDRFLADLPFRPTDGQLSAIAEIRADLGAPPPMHRLLQGDVGAGKTVVAAAAMLVAVEGGHQAALMAPTEVLAEQHALALGELLASLEVDDDGALGGRRPLTVALVTGRTPAAERSRVRAGLADGSVDVVVGTHALLTEDVVFRSLGVAVVDEQHRFGVEQRAALRAKGGFGVADGPEPDLLVMTATPIPRTAAMVLFGDLDLTIIDELPPGRIPVETTWARSPLEVAAAWARVREEVAAGHRAFVVCPLVEGSERVEARSAVEEAERLAADELAGLRVGLLHGQLRPSDKQAAMGAFRRGELDVLVATTVIEVGVDVPEATVMVVESADRFGIAQLHQLRGRVGRGGDPSWCFLLAEDPGPEGEARLGALESSTDGFALAEVDLSLRGEGTLLGARQQGRSDLKLARLLEDADLVVAAREVADALVADDPTLEQAPLLADELELFVDDGEAEYLVKS
ncbi:MAG: ATP-dependent DNA helicase RecG [Actinomycetota bacterium]|nr:ATP-dependent DNA helicase RecG [Actinomycetota bacterium]